MCPCVGDCTAMPGASSLSILLSTLAAWQGSSGGYSGWRCLYRAYAHQGYPRFCFWLGTVPSWGSGSILWGSRWESTVNALLPVNGFLLLISSRQVITFAAASLFGEKMSFISPSRRRPGGDAPRWCWRTPPRLSCRRHLVGKGEKDKK